MATKTKVQYETTLVLETCCSCGVPFGLSGDHYDRLNASGDTFYCPNGHPQIYTKRKNLEQQLADAEAKLASEREAHEWYAEAYKEKRAELNETKNSLRATKAAHTRTKNRINNGVCPCCNRQFLNLHQHMKTKHPDYTGDDDNSS